jgi:hypothetical protein
MNNLLIDFISDAIGIVVGLVSALLVTIFIVQSAGII